LHYFYDSRGFKRVFFLIMYVNIIKYNIKMRSVTGYWGCGHILRLKFIQFIECPLTHKLNAKWNDMAGVRERMNMEFPYLYL
jgi:hypothetical protein